ncbi:MAG: peptide-binding protein [Candidatus Hydrogenedentes bacterium]|nr:peptide-binding protein [Candidatus Hydrogenedentota bacterium]
MRKFLPLFVVSILTLAALSCGGPPPSTDTSAPASAPTTSSPATTATGDQASLQQTPDEGDWIIEHLSAEPALLNPILDLGDASSQYICNLIFDPLLEVDNKTLELKPKAAESWSVSDDHLTYTFVLRKDIKFSDGTPLTANDYKFTYDLIKDPKNDTAATRSYLVDVVSVEVVNDYEIKFTCAKPYFKHVYMLSSIQAMPRHVYSNGEFNKHPNNRNPIGSGPYKFESWDTGQQITLARNEQYWDKKPQILKHVFKIITDDNAAFQVLERGELDTANQIPPDIWVGRANSPQFTQQFTKLTPQSPIPGYMSRVGYIGWNMRKPQFDDKRVRTALTLLLDRQLILDKVYMGLGEVVSGDCFPGEPEYDKNIKPLPFDPAAASKLLEEAGWIDADKDGVRERNGVRLEFELTFASAVPEYERFATYYQEELTRAGIKMTPRPMEWAAFQERVQNRTFDACMLAWITTPFYDPYQLWHSSQAEKGSNYPGLKNAEVDELMEKARVEFDRSKRIPMYHRVQAIIQEEQPYTFLFSRYGLVVVSKRFQNVNVYPIGLDPREWWVPKAMQRYK